MPSRFPAFAFLIALIISVATLAPAQQSKADSDAAISQHLEAIEQTWLNAEKNHDAATFETLVTDDWTSLTPDGKTQTKAERSAKIKASHVVTATLGDMKVRVLGDTAVVTGTDDEAEGGKTTHYVWMDVFVKRSGKWLAVASQTALVR